MSSKWPQGYKQNNCNASLGYRICHIVSINVNIVMFVGNEKQNVPGGTTNNTIDFQGDYIFVDFADYKYS